MITKLHQELWKKSTLLYSTTAAAAPSSNLTAFICDGAWESLPVLAIPCAAQALVWLQPDTPACLGTVPVSPRR